MEGGEKRAAASVCVIVLQTIALHSISGSHNDSWGGEVGGGAKREGV